MEMFCFSVSQYELSLASKDDFTDKLHDLNTTLVSILGHKYSKRFEKPPSACKFCR